MNYETCKKQAQTEAFRTGRFMVMAYEPNLNDYSGDWRYCFIAEIESLFPFIANAEQFEVIAPWNE